MEVLGKGPVLGNPKPANIAVTGPGATQNTAPGGAYGNPPQQQGNSASGPPKGNAYGGAYGAPAGGAYGAPAAPAYGAPGGYGQQPASRPEPQQTGAHPSVQLDDAACVRQPWLEQARPRLLAAERVLLSDRGWPLLAAFEIDISTVFADTAPMTCFFAMDASKIMPMADPMSRPQDAGKAADSLHWPTSWTCRLADCDCARQSSCWHA